MKEELRDDWREIEVINCRVRVTSDGQVQMWTEKDNCWLDRTPRLNNDGYLVCSLTGKDENGKRIYRGYGIHILVAKAFVPNPDNKPEVNHKDFNRANPKAENLEWVTRKENMEYSAKANRMPRRYGADNPNFGNDTLHKRYMEDKEFAKEKQGRPGGRNGRAKKCKLLKFSDKSFEKIFDYQRDAVYYLQELEEIPIYNQPETAIRQLKTTRGLCGYYLTTL